MTGQVGALSLAAVVVLRRRRAAPEVVRAVD